MMRRRYDKQGILALYPQAFFDLFVESGERSNESHGDCEIVEIRGPLEHHDDWWCDSYEAIVDRVTAACESSSNTIVLKIDSPGGELLGCFDAARTVRARAQAAGKRLVAYVEGCACSAAYAFAAACEQIVLSDTSFVGSIGVLLTRVDLTARDTSLGARFAFVASGARKLDGNPHAMLSESELTVLQKQCDSLAALFFEFVASLRGVEAEAIGALEAGIFHGAEAVAAGLADRVQTFDELLGSIASGEINMAAESDKKDEENGGASPFDAAREALEKASDGDDPNAQRAKRALELLNAPDESTPDDDDEKKDKKKDGDTSASSSPSAAAAPRISAESGADLASTVIALSKDVAELKGAKEALERSALLSSRPDLPKALAERLQKMPLADARAIVDCMPKSDAPPPNPAATATVQATRGATQVGGEGNQPVSTPETKALDEAFGLLKPAGGVRREGCSMIFEMPTRDRKDSKPAAAAAAEGK